MNGLPLHALPPSCASKPMRPRHAAPHLQKVQGPHKSLACAILQGHRIHVWETAHLHMRAQECVCTLLSVCVRARMHVCTHVCACVCCACSLCHPPGPPYSCLERPRTCALTHRYACVCTCACLNEPGRRCACSAFAVVCKRILRLILQVAQKKLPACATYKKSQSTAYSEVGHTCSKRATLKPRTHEAHMLNAALDMHAHTHARTHTCRMKRRPLHHIHAKHACYIYVCMHTCRVTAARASDMQSHSS